MTRKQRKQAAAEARYRPSTNEWCFTLDAFKALDPGKIWALLMDKRRQK